MAYAHINANTAGTPIQKGTTGLKAIIIGTPGTSWVIDVYDDVAATAANKVSSIAAVDGGQYVFETALTRGLYIVASGTTAGDATIVYD